MKPKVGTPLFGDGFGLAQPPRIDAKSAAARALQAYLEMIVFRLPDGKEFQFRQVLRDWPESFEGMRYPSAAITVATEPRDAHSLTPTPLEETQDVYCPGTVLWKTSELALDFQVDCWLNSATERTAVVTRFDDAFNPSESRAGVLLQGPPEYYDRIVRCTFTGGSRIDNSQANYDRERQYHANILAEIDVVHLRRAVDLDPILSLDGEPVARTRV